MLLVLIDVLLNTLCHEIEVEIQLSHLMLFFLFQAIVGCRIYEDRIPIDYQTAVMAEEIGMNLVTAALNGGEDYELLFTVPIHFHDIIDKIEGIKIIGHITKKEYGCLMETRDGNEINIKAQGWNPLN